MRLTTTIYFLIFSIIILSLSGCFSESDDTEISDSGQNKLVTSNEKYILVIDFSQEVSVPEAIEACDNLEFPEFYPENDRDVCLDRFGTHLKSLEICEKIDTLSGHKAGESDYGRIHCFKSVAISTKNPEICEQIPSLECNPEYNNCDIVSLFKKSESEECLELLDSPITTFSELPKIEPDPLEGSVEDLCADAFVKDDCYLREGRSRFDIDTCNLISDANMKDRCIYTVGIEKNDLTLCDSLYDLGRKEECKKQVIIKTDQKQLCDSLSIERKKDWCNLNFAINKGDSSVCPSLNSEIILNNKVFITFSDLCWSGLGINGDSDCKNINQASVKSICDSGGGSFLINEKAIRILDAGDLYFNLWPPSHVEDNEQD